MEEKYITMAKIFKALSDPKRVQILDILSEGEVCACILLEHFHISQPTLSHDMKVLIESGIVNSRRDGQRTLYFLNMDSLKKMQPVMKRMLQSEEKPQAE
ncbi:MAG: winged helix-turn-helix transcriptional regulator [Clostridia bacterium]|nr:winged helix-turn-helix transcriptional regulator [Clostridia bacterium]